MQACILDGQFGLENLRFVERPAPQPAADEVLIEIRAVSLNYRDWLMVNGLYNPKQPLPLVPLSDGVGLVRAVGAKVKNIQVGQRVVGSFLQRWLSGPAPRSIEILKATLGGPLDGMLQQQICLPAQSVVVVPDYLSDVEAATLPCAALTAWSALVDEAQLAPGDTVVVQGTGGVSLFAVQIAKLMGLRVILTSKSAEKLTKLVPLGADLHINYQATPDWSRVVLDATQGGADLVVEVGGADTFAQSLRAVRPGGQIALIGVLSGVETKLNLLPILMRNVRVQGVLVGSRDRLANMCRAFAQHEVHPVIDRVFPFAEAPAALAYLATGQHVGKVCVAFAGS